MNTLDEYRRDALLSHDELWFRYFELGGMSTALEWRPSFTERFSPAPTTVISSLTP